MSGNYLKINDMKKLWLKIQKLWLFHVANPVIRTGEGHGFKYTFRKYWLEIESISGNWKTRVTASEHPFAYLLVSVEQGNENLFGFAEMMYYLSSTLTRDQGLVNDVQKALRKYEIRLSKTDLEPEEEEKVAIEEVKGVQEYVEATPKQRRKMERDINGRFKKAVQAQNLQESE